MKKWHRYRGVFLFIVLCILLYPISSESMEKEIRTNKVPIQQWISLNKLESTKLLPKAKPLKVLTPIEAKQSKPARITRPKKITSSVDHLRVDQHQEYHNLDEALKNVDKVIKLNLSYQIFEYFPYEIFTLTNLKSLNLSNMELDEIVSEISHLVKLNELILKHNQLRFLPDEICELGELKVLDLSNNQMEMLPYDISNLSSLRILKLSNNNISSLPEGIEELTNLKFLYLDGNPISEWQMGEIVSSLPECRVIF